LDLKVFDGQDKSELSMIEVAHAILAHHGEAMAFVDLTNEVQQYLGKSDEEIRERLAHIYTPEDAMKCIYLGAHSVVVGSAITRPHLTAKRFVDLLGGYQDNWRDAEKAKH